MSIFAQPSRRISLAAAAAALVALGAPAASGAQSAANPDPPPGGSPAVMPETVDGRALVRFLPGVGEAERDRALRAAAVEVDRPMGLENAFEVRFDEERDPQVVARELGGQPGVKWAEPDFYGEPVGTELGPDPSVEPADPSFGAQWNMASIGAPQAWGITEGDVDPLIAVIDTGFNFSHNDLWPAFYTNPGEHQPGLTNNGKDDDGNGYVDDWRGYDFGSGDNNAWDTTDQGSVGFEHGMNVAGVIGATPNELGITGVARTSSILPIKVFKDNGKFTHGRLADGIAYADRMGAEIANVSLTVGVWTNAVSDAITEANHTLVVAGAGNDDYDLDKIVREAYPCESNHANVICVGAHEQDGSDAAWSNEGDEVDLAAPGEDILTTGMGFADQEGKVDDLDTVSGTSFSTAHVSAVAALLWGMNGWIEDQNQWTRAESARWMILESVIDEPTLHNRVGTGGRLDAYGALLRLPLRMPKIVTYDAPQVDKTYFTTKGKLGHRGINITQVGWQYQVKGQPQTRKTFWYERTRDSLGLLEGAVGDTIVPVAEGTTYEYRYVAHNPYGTNDLSSWKTVTTPGGHQPLTGPGGITNPPKPTHTPPAGPGGLAAG